MLIFGHTGITLGATLLLTGVWRGGAFSQARENKAAGQETPVSKCPPNDKLSRFIFLRRYIDIRLLLIGSLLPDIIDKPVGQFFFRETFSSGRIFSHTLIFFTLLALVGFYLYQRYRKVWLLVLSFGTFTHLILDQMWCTPRTLFWPFLGFGFERTDITDWLPNIAQSLLINPEVYIPELVGAAIFLWFGLTLVLRREVLAFLKSGRFR